MTFSYADVNVLAFILIPVALVALLAWGIASASRRIGEADSAASRAVTAVVAAAAWMAITWYVADSGVLRRWEAVPPPFALFVVALLAVAGVLSLGRYGRILAAGTPIWMLVGVQGFRLPLELAMHGMYERGVMPVQMSYSGLNFDIVTGATAILVAAVVRKKSYPKLVAVWNVIGLVLLTNIVTVAILSTPQVQYFGPDRLNVWVTYPPFVWLPAVMVVCALAGHLIIFRALRSRARP